VDSFVADAFALPSASTTGGAQVMSVSIKGSFKEIESNTMRFFHRSFLLGPPVRQTAFPVCILNDSLHITSHSEDLEADKSAAMPSIGVAQPVSPLDSLGPAEKALVMQVMQSEGVPAELALQALQHASGDAAKAVQAIKQLKASQGTR
jgi:hypothetical protein